MNSFRQWNFCSLPRHKEQLKEETNNNKSCMLQLVHFALLAGVVSIALCYGESKIALSLLACCFCCCYFHLLTCFPTTASCLYLQFINYFVKQFHFLSVFALAVCKNIYRFLTVLRSWLVALIFGLLNVTHSWVSCTFLRFVEYSKDLINNYYLKF